VSGVRIYIRAPLKIADILLLHVHVHVHVHEQVA
jgi:hypothetical protein